MRRAARIDANQPAIVKALRAIGCSVTETSGVGGGFPDLAVGFRKRTTLLEVKDGSKPPSARELTPDQVLWHISWRGQVAVVTSVEEAIAAVSAEGNP